MPSNFKALAGASGGEPIDANFKNVTLLLHGDGSNGAQNNTFLDSSTNNFTITRNGNTTQGSFSPYGSNWSNYFDGSGDYLSAPSNAALDCGTGDWTFECWVFVSTRTTNYPLIFGNNRGGFTTDALAFTASNSDSGGIYQDRFVVAWGSSGWSSPSTGNSALLVANATNSNNTWYHLALVRNGTSVKMYRNGVEVASATVSAGATFNWGYNGALVGGGNWDGAGSYFNGYISNLRLLKGTALYTAAFTPSTTPLTAITNTSLLTCQSNRFRDASTNNFTITRNGDVKVTNFAPFAPSSAYSTTTNGGSAYFDGTGDYLTSATATAPGTGDFTVEGWFNMPSIGSTRIIYDCRPSGTNGVYQTIYVDLNGYLSLYANSADRIKGATVVSLNDWNHFALCRSGTSTKLFLNGVQQGITYSDSANWLMGSSRPAIGADGSSLAASFFIGYLSNIRAVNGTALYTSAFTPPTAPLTAITNTSLLLNFTNAAIFDNSMKNDLETVGNAQISTSVKKFGTGSMAFDGSGDYLSTPASPAFDFGSGDFTLECWVYRNNSGGTGLFDSRGGSAGLLWYIDGTNQYARVYIQATAAHPTSTITVPTNQWVHLAVTRSSGVLYFWMNGQAAGSSSITTSIGSTATLRFGASNDAAIYNGYIDDFRITKGVARYTANFTPPTAAFPNK